MKKNLKCQEPRAIPIALTFQSISAVFFYFAIAFLLVFFVASAHQVFGAEAEGAERPVKPLVLVSKEAPAAPSPQLPAAQGEKPLETAVSPLEPGAPSLEELSRKFGVKEDVGLIPPAPAKSAVESKSQEVSASQLMVKEESEESATKVITGEVSAKGTNGISVVSAKNEKEKSSSDLWFSFEPKLKFSGYTSADNIGAGDLVKVTYEDAKDGSSRVVKEIALEKKKPSEAKQPEPAEEK